MKRYLLLIIIVLSLCNTISAQAVRGIIFADTNDEKIGEGVKVNVRNMTNFMALVATATGYVDSPPVIVRAGYSCNKQNLLNVLSELECEPDDIVIFAYFGHGARAYTDESEFPQMCLGSNIESNFYPLENVKDLIMQKNPNFCFVMGDCCNSYGSGITTKPSITSAAGASYITRQGESGLKKLFVDNTGYVLSSGSTKGEYSWINSRYGGFYMQGILYTLTEYVNKTRNSYDWSELMPQIKTNVVNYSGSLGSQYLQHPVFLIEKGNPHSHIDKDKNKKDRIIPKNDFRSALVSVASDNNSDIQRIRESQQVLSNYFESGNVIIDIIGQDGFTIVQQETADEFLLRISTGKNLANFSILEERKNSSGKLTYVMLHEIYMER